MAKQERERRRQAQRAHWHHFWAGSETRDDRHLRLHWVSPIRVNAELPGEVMTVVRPADP